MLFQEHLAKHAGDKPYKCEVCPKQFNHKTDLRRHMCLHTGEKPFTCDVCGKGFIREDRMVKHADTHKKKAQVGGGLMWQQADTGGHVYWPGGHVPGHHHMWWQHVASSFRSTWSKSGPWPSIMNLSDESLVKTHFLWSIPWQDITHVPRVRTCRSPHHYVYSKVISPWCHMQTNELPEQYETMNLNKLYRKWFCRSFVKI